MPAPPCAKPEPKPKVYINKQAPIVINRKAQSYVVNAGAPVIIKPAPVVIQRPGHSEFRPIVQTVTSAPIIVDKKIIKIERPIVKKFYQEAFSQTLPSECGHTIPLKPVLPPPCNNLPVAPLPLAPLPAPLPVVPPFPAAALPERKLLYLQLPDQIKRNLLTHTSFYFILIAIAIQPVESVPAEISALLAGVSPPAASPCGCPLI